MFGLLDFGLGGMATTATTSANCYFTVATTCTSSAMNSMYQTQAAGTAYNQGLAGGAGGGFEDSRSFLRREAIRQAAILKAHAPDAQERAQELLLAHLTPEQRSTFKKNGWFVVVGGRSGKRYRIAANDNLAANIYVLDGEAVSHRLCAHCDLKTVPLADHLLAQKITLETAEDEFLSRANLHAA